MIKVKPMRITKEELKNIINEEVASVLQQSLNRKRIAEAVPRARRGALYGVPANELIAFAKAYSELGEAITEQLETIIKFGANADPDEVNPTDVREIVSTLGGVNAEIDEQLAEWRSANGVTSKPRRGTRDASWIRP